jgi:SDR family mycofactocin-dependent oxidoreductase
MTPTLPLDDQVAIVTGGARGQGRTHAIALAELGASIVVCDGPEPMTSVPYALGSLAELDETVAAVERVGGKALAVSADVRRRADVDRVVEQAIDRFGRIDILVANAGIATQGKMWELSDEAWHEMIDTNLTGVFHSLRAVVPHMRERQYGRIVVISSQGGRTGLPNISHYAAAKWGVIGLAKSLALELVHDGITVNVVCPTTVRTPMVLNETTYRLFAPDAGEITEELIGQRFSAHHPIPRPWLEPEDVSREVVHLVTERGNVTGAVVEIGLGLSAKMH